MDYEQKLKEVVMNDVRFIALLKAVEELHLPDSWICAGCLRNKIWDELDSISTPMNDIDVIYFDEANTSKAREKRLESQLQVFIPSEPWSVKNQARMHEKNGSTPYQSSFDAVANFPETATAVAIRITNNELEVMAPYGLQDLFSKSVKPTPPYEKTSDLHSVYLERVSQKKWDEIWSHVFVGK